MRLKKACDGLEEFRYVYILTGPMSKKNKKRGVNQKRCNNRALSFSVDRSPYLERVKFFKKRHNARPNPNSDARGLPLVAPRLLTLENCPS